MHEDGYFDEGVASSYDDDTEMFKPQTVGPVVDFLAALSSDGTALEFGVGTGRIALPLASRGVAVTGIDLSNPMVERLKAKSGSAGIGVVVGDFATVSIGKTFSVVYLVFNTIMNLTTQAAQVECFRNAAAHLKPGGRFVIEVMMPRLGQLSESEPLVAYDLTDTHWGIDRYDIATQSLISHHLRIVDGNTERSSVPFRYVWPAELDLMAQLADMTLTSRAGGWRGEPFTAMSAAHVSVWTKS